MRAWAIVAALWLMQSASLADGRHIPARCETAQPLAGGHGSPLQSRLINVNGLSSFGGLTLASTPEEIDAAVKSVGIVAEPHTFEGHSNGIAWMDLCKGKTPIGTVVFDESGVVKRIVLEAGFFVDDAPAFREFADRLFALYTVRPDAKSVACGPATTCVSGKTRAGERFLISEIGETITLYVMPPKRASRPLRAPPGTI